MSGEVEKCPILHVRPKFDVFYHDIDFLSVICLDIFREYVTRLSDKISHRFGRKKANNL